MESRERVIDSLHREAMVCMDRFAFTSNGSQELPRLLAKAKAMADVYPAPEEVRGLFDYCQHMIDLMAHIIRNRLGICIYALILMRWTILSLNENKFGYGVYC